MQHYDVRDDINEFLDTTDLTEPRAIAAELAENVPSQRLRVALAQALVATVRDVIRARRNFAPPIPEKKAMPGLEKYGRPTRRTSSKSTKRTLIAEAHERRLRDLVYVGGGKRLHLGDCSYENLTFIANHYEMMAKETLNKAARFSALASALDSHKANNVRELPIDVFNEIMDA